MTRLEALAWVDNRLLRLHEALQAGDLVRVEIHALAISALLRELRESGHPALDLEASIARAAGRSDAVLGLEQENRPDPPSS